MKKVYLILGEWHVGKSTLIRTLTGITRASRPRLRFVGGMDVDLYAWIRSMQEDNPVMSPIDLLNDITSPQEIKFEYYLIPIRIDALNGCPGGQDYIDILHKHCRIMGVVVLSKGNVIHKLSIPTPYLDIINSTTLPANNIANQVRTLWGWE